MPKGEDYPHKDALALYTSACEKLKQEVKGKNSAYTSVNGWMCTFLDDDALLNIRVGKKNVDHFMTEFPCERTKQYGKNMPDFVKLIGESLKNEKLVLKCISISMDHCHSLKPKK